MALVLPFTVAFGIYSWQQRRIRWVQLAVLSGAITAGGLFFTSSIGAWLALAIGLGCWFVWEASGRLHKKTPLSQKAIFAIFVILLTLFGLLLLRFVLGSGVVQEDSATRWGLARQTLFLIEDFALTGSGLATFPALYAQYVRVTPAFFAAYSNLYLDIWLEQGFLAFVVLLVLLGSSFWLLFKRSAFVGGKPKPEPLPNNGQILEDGPRRRKRKKKIPQEMSLFRWAAFVSLMVMVLHGLIDDALYGNLASPFLFFAPAMVVLVTRRRESAAVIPLAVKRRHWLVGMGVTAVLLVGLFVGFRQTIRAQWQANLGALAMARAELVGWPTNQWDEGENLGRFEVAQAFFERSVALDADNQTANYRLGMLAMLARDYETAVTHLELAEAKAQAHRGIAKSLGYSYVWRGQFDKALQTLVVIEEARAEMNVYSNWWERQNRQGLAAKASEMFTLLENTTMSLMP